MNRKRLRRRARGGGRGRQRFEEVEHTADRAFRAFGHDLRELFVHAAQAMFDLQGESGRGRATVTRDVSVAGLDRETLLVNWLNELLYLQEVHGESYSRLDIQEISETHLRARVHGRRQPGARRLIKAVTFHNLKVKPSARGWQATLVVDV